MPLQITVPQLGESIVEATISRWLKREGDAVEAGETLAELETDKVNLEVPAEQAGVLQEITRQDGATVQVGEVIGLLAEGTAPAAGRANGAQQTSQSPDANATPVAKRLAADNKLDLRTVKGTGPHGRITKEDVATHIERRDHSPGTANRLGEAAAQQPRPQAPAPPVTPAAPAPAPSSDNGRTEERVRMSRRRQTIAARLVEAQRTAAMLTTFNEADMTAVMEIRKRRKEAFKERHGVNLGFMSFFTRAAVAALRAFPLLNAEIQGEEIVVKRYYDIGVAVSTDDGLVVPVLRGADHLSFAEIEQAVADLAARAREGRLTLPEIMGGTFTITNGGIFGSLMSTPILNTPQVGILGMHKIQERPVAVNGQVAIRPMMYLALSYDHRIVDGADAVRFLVMIKELIEDPASLLLEG